MKELSSDHKAALKAGRKNAAIVRRYLEAIERQRPRRGRRRTPESIGGQLSEIDTRMKAGLSPIKRLELIQRRLDLQAALAELESAGTDDISALEADFIGVVAAYSEAKSITWPAWREVGVAADVLRRGGLTQTRS